MSVIGIDAGPTKSAYVIWNGHEIITRGNLPNRELLTNLEFPTRFCQPAPTVCAIEQIRGFGVLAGNPLFDTCCWTGRFLQVFGEYKTVWVPRKEASAHICGTGGISKDQFIRAAIIERFGGKDIAIGTKKTPGPLYGITGSHFWAALAVALTYWDKNVQP